MKLLSSVFGAALLASSLPHLAYASPAKSSPAESSDPSETASGPSSTPSGGTSSDSTSGGGSNKDRFTFYNGGGALGACGKPVNDGDYTVALNQAQFGSGYPGPHCFQEITITYNGKTHDATITDECPGCPEGGLDLTPTLFEYFASPDVGVIYGEWSFKDGSSGSSGSSTTGSKGASSTGTGSASPTTATDASHSAGPTSASESGHHSCCKSHSA